MSQERIASLRKRLVAEGLDGLVITSPQNFRYLTGFQGDAGVLLVGLGDAVLFTDSRFVEAAQAEVQGAGVKQHLPKIEESLGREIARQGGERWGFEADIASYAFYARLGASGAPLVPTEGLVQLQRAVKDASEQAAIRRACAIASDALDEAIERLREGVREVDAALWLEMRMREMGAEGTAFPFIVASGPRGSLPHGLASERRIGRGELVTFDVGCRYLGYHSDLTRTLAVGEVRGQLREVYEVVRTAQAAGLRAVRAGIPARDVDAAARHVIEEAGYGERFGHSTGHGVGLEVHEQPSISTRSEAVLEPGMVVTVEPGIYLPGVGGVRIEDTVVVTESGCEILTPSPKLLRTA